MASGTTASIPSTADYPWSYTPCTGIRQAAWLRRQDSKQEAWEIRGIGISGVYKGGSTIKRREQEAYIEARGGYRLCQTDCQFRCSCTRDGAIWTRRVVNENRAQAPRMPTTNITIFGNGRTEHTQLSFRPTPLGERMSTSQVTLLRLALAEDEYLPCTLNPRQHQGLAQIWRTGSIDEAYNPTVGDRRAGVALLNAADS